MTTKNILSLLVVLLFAAGISLASGAAFNVTQILSKYPDFASFNDFLSVTGLADEINSRQTITVLAVDDSGIDAVAGRPVDIVKRILSVHVILDYFDSAKLAKLSGKTSLLTTLFQSSGFASNKAGFLNVTDMDDDMVSFGSAAPGSGIGANLVKEVFTKPYDLSILQVSDIIVPPGIENLQADTPAASSPPPTTNAPPPTTTTTRSTTTTAPPPKTGTTTSTTTAPPPKTGTTTTTSTTTAPPPKTGTTTTTTAAAPAPKSSSTTTSTPTPTAAPAKSSSPAAAPTKEATASAPSKTAPAPTKPAAAPTTTSTSTSPSASPSSENAAAPTAETPSATTAPSASTEAPTSEAPQASSPTSAIADGPSSDAAAPVTSESGAGRLVAGATAATLAMAVIISAF